MTLEGFKSVNIHGETLWYNVSSHTNKNTKGFMMNQELAEIIGNSIGTAGAAMREMSIDLSIIAAELAIELATGNKLQPEHKEHIRFKLEEFADENMERYIRAVYEANEHHE